eukprot:g9713.t1
MWFAVGNMIAGRGGNGFIGTKAGFWFTGEQFDEDDSSLSHVRFLFSGMLAATSVTIMSGSVADRVPYKLYLIYAATTCAVSYPLLAHWAWSDDGWASSQVGRFSGCGVLDFAGSGVVHAFAGMSTMVFASNLPSRKDRFQYGDGVNVNKALARRGPIVRVLYRDGFTRQNRTNQALGMFLLWFGCIKEACFSKVYDKRHPGIFDNENEDLHSAAINGVLSGLVSITAGCATTDPRITMLVAIGAAFVYHLTYRAQLQFGLDDAVNAMPVHLYCGLYGLFLAGWTFSDELHNDYLSSLDIERGSCHRNYQAAANCAFLVVLIVWSGFVAFALFKALDKLVGGTLADPKDEPPTPEIDDLWYHQNKLARETNRNRARNPENQARNQRRGRQGPDVSSSTSAAAEGKSIDAAEKQSEGEAAAQLEE